MLLNLFFHHVLRLLMANQPRIPSVHVARVVASDFAAQSTGALLLWQFPCDFAPKRNESLRLYMAPGLYQNIERADFGCSYAFLNIVFLIGLIIKNCFITVLIKVYSIPEPNSEIRYNII
ncbi:hypothetical protein NPIL_170111 [Nephila pilipes]|uniref:Uncharacterized protein n=1 Tax=Nephila pilipes TaxID=299642 RepID=A0A8X6NXX1_NEPPI|nr:hypothetical protein NPIL_170111 [Nephila pilipes]